MAGSVSLAVHRLLGHGFIVDSSLAPPSSQTLVTESSISAVAAPSVTLTLRPDPSEAPSISTDPGHAGTARADPGILFPSSRASPLVTRSRQELNYLLVSYFDNVEAQQTLLDQYQTLENVFGINGFTVRSCRSICRIFTRLLFHT